MSLNNRIFHGFLKSVDTTGRAQVSKIYRRLYGLQLNLCIRTENPFTVETRWRCVQNIRQNIRPLADLSVPAEFHLWSFTISFKAFSMRPCRGQPKKSEQEENSTLFPRLVISHHSSISKRMKQSGGTAIMPRGRQG